MKHRKGKSTKKVQLGKVKLPYAKRLKLGFAKVHGDLDWLMGSFCEMLHDIGEENIEKVLPFQETTQRDLRRLRREKSLGLTRLLLVC